MWIQNSDALQDWLRLSSVSGLGASGARRLLASGSPEQLLQCRDVELLSKGLKPELLPAFRECTTRVFPSVSKWLDSGSHRYVISCCCPEYPMQLNEVHSAPVLLFAEGAIDLLSLPQIAMVGTRNPTPGGMTAARSLTQELVCRDFVITSGLALGIDAECHRACLQHGGKTIAVLGSGLAQCYPRRNQALAEQILASGGVLVSEFFPDVSPRPEYFPMRNRIISGLALGTVVIEASLRSGSLITARYALEQNREVFAVPGAIHNPAAAGCLHLIQQGAKLVTCAADIEEEVRGQLRPRSLKPKVVAGLPSPALLDNVGYETTSIDEIAACSGQSLSEVMQALLLLELSGLIVSVPGGYVRTRRD